MKSETSAILFGQQLAVFILDLTIDLSPYE